MTDRILRTFWHKSRRCIVPKTREDIHHVIKGDPDDLETAMRSMSRKGLVKSTAAKGDGNVSIYDLTEAGRTALMALIMAEAGA